MRPGAPAGADRPDPGLAGPSPAVGACIAPGAHPSVARALAAGGGCNAACGHAPAQEVAATGSGRPPSSAPRACRPPAVHRYGIQDLLQHPGRRGGGILHDHAVRHRRREDLLDQVDRDPVVAAYQRQRTRQPRHLDPGTRTGPGLDRRVTACLADQRHQVGDHFLVDGDRIHHRLPLVEPFLRHHRREAAPGVVAAVLVHDALLVVVAGITQGELHHETVELRHRQREQVRALEVHGGDDEERVGQVVGVALDRDRLLLHRLEEAALGLGGEQVDLVAQHEVGEDRTAVEDQ